MISVEDSRTPTTLTVPLSTSTNKYFSSSDYKPINLYTYIFSYVNLEKTLKTYKKRN